MKKTLLTLLLLSLTALPALAQPLSKAEYLGRWQRLTERVGVAGVGVETLIGQWAEAWPDDVQMLLARFSFYYNKSQSAKVIQLSQDRYLGRAPLLPMKDSTGAVRNYFEDTVFDDSLFGQAEEAISRAIALQPLRLDWRLVRITALTAYEKGSPDMALATAEYFATQENKRVLVLLTDMTNFCDALKEIAITMEQIPSNRGYPGDLYSQLASRYEKAVDFETAGSITILAVTTMPGDDVTHPVPDNTGYITEGQFYLVNGRIEPFGSLSRLKQQVNSETRADHRALMDNMIRLYAEYKEALEKQSMGFKMSDWDSKLLKYGNLFEQRMMDLRVNIPLEEALDLGWKTLAECFTPAETGIKTDLVKQFWPKNS